MRKKEEKMMIKQFQYNERLHKWQRVDHIQEYKGCKIETLTTHMDYLDPCNIKNSREYRVTWPDGHTSCFPINKRGGNIKNLKEYIDFKFKYQ